MSPTLKKGTTCLTFWAGVGAVAMGDRMAHVGSWVQGASKTERGGSVERVVADWGGSRRRGYLDNCVAPVALCSFWL